MSRLDLSKELISCDYCGDECDIYGNCDCDHKLGDEFRLEVEGHCTYCDKRGL